MKFPKLSGKALLSPMVGVTDVAFRALCKKYGAALTYTEFVHGTAIVNENDATLKKIETDPSEKPVAIQLFGSSIKDVVEAAKIVEKKFDIIDVNCGCPAWKVVKEGAGSAMLNNPEMIFEFISKIVDSVKIPVTLKIRTGINDNKINAVEVAKTAEDAGAAAIAVHGRTQKQGYSGCADWNIIKQVKENVSIPVIGNGDVFSPEDFKKRIDESGVDYIMLARGAIGAPFLFSQVSDFLKNGMYSEYNRASCFMEYLELARKYNISFSHTKNHAVHFTKGITGGANIRRNIMKFKTNDEIEDYFKKLIP